MKKFVSLFLAFLVATSCCLAFTGCGSKAASKAPNLKSETYAEDAAGDFDATADNESLEMSESPSSTKENSTVKTNRKIIERINLSLQTKEFDTLVDKVNSKVLELGGYIEASEIDGGEIGSNTSRWAEITARIPSDKSGQFGDYIAKNSVVVNRAVTTEDVTLKYVDNESRVKALEAEKKSLEKILENAVSVEDIISIRSQLTNVIYEIESLKSQLRTYDNLIDYTTVTITIDEVERTEIVEKQSVWQKIGTNLKNNFSDLWSMLVALFVFFVSAIPFFIPIVLIIILVVFVVKRKNKKQKKAPTQDK